MVEPASELVSCKLIVTLAECTEFTLNLHLPVVSFCGRMAAEVSRTEAFVKRLDFSSGNLATKWKKFKSELKIYLVVKKLTVEEEKIAHMLVLMGADAVPVYEQFVFDETKEDQKKTLDNVITMFDTHFEPVKNVIYERMLFYQMYQQPGQSIHQFIVSVQNQADNCEFGTLKSEMIRDRIVVGVTDDKLREYLYDTPKLDMLICIQKAKQFTSYHEQASKMGPSYRKPINDNVDAVQDSSNPMGATAGRTSTWERKGLVEPRDGSSKTVVLSKRCGRCDKMKHFRGTCPAARSNCRKCGEKGHWEKCCTEASRVNELEANVAGRMDSLYMGSDSS